MRPSSEIVQNRYLIACLQQLYYGVATDVAHSRTISLQRELPNQKDTNNFSEKDRFRTFEEILTSSRNLDKTKLKLYNWKTN